MEKLLDILADLVPVWVAFLAIAFGYLVYLFRKASKEFISLGEKQAEYLRDRVDVVDKATTIFSRTIDQQEKEISKLTDRLRKLDTYVDESRGVATEQAIREIKTLERTITNVAKLQEALIALLGADISKFPEISQLRLNIEENLQEDIPSVIRSRDLSLYRIKASNCEGARAMVEKSREHGFTASIYLGPYLEKESLEEEEREALEKSLPVDVVSEHEAIWVGSRIPPKVAVQAISIGVKHWPFLKYVHLSSDKSPEAPDYIHSELYFGGSTATATERFHLRPWGAQDFKNLSQEMSLKEFHAYIRNFYPH